MEFVYVEMLKVSVVMNLGGGRFCRSFKVA